MHALGRLPQLEPSAGFRSGVSTRVFENVRRRNAAGALAIINGQFSRAADTQVSIPHVTQVRAGGILF